MTCNWITIWDAPTGGNQLSPSALTENEEVYLDISGIPSNYTFKEWRDAQGHIISSDIISSVGNNRYKTTVQCGYFYQAYIIQDPDSICRVSVACFPTEAGTVSISIDENQQQCGDTVEIHARPNDCCYEFDTWDDLLPDKEEADRSGIPVTQPPSLYTAYFKKKKFHIDVLSSNDCYGTVSMLPTDGEVECGQEFTLKVGLADNDEYQFDGWNDGNTEIERNITFDCETQRLYQANISKIPRYEITYNLNYGAVPEILNGGKYTSDTLITYYNISREHYHFLGWSTNPSATTADYSADGQSHPFPFSSDTTLYAVWEACQSYRIYYYNGNPDDISVTPLQSETYEEGEAFTLYTPNLVTSNVFVGWAICNGCSSLPVGIKHVQGTYVMPNHNLEAYAQWTAEGSEGFQITYVANNGTAQSTSINVLGGYNPIETIDYFGFTYAHKTFKKWVDGNNQSYYPNTSTIYIDRDTTLTAVWEDSPSFNISYILNTSCPSQIPNTQTGIYSNTPVTLNNGNNITCLSQTTQPTGWKDTYTHIVYDFNDKITNVTDNMTLQLLTEEECTFRVRYVMNIPSGVTCDNPTEDPTQYAAGTSVTVLGVDCPSGQDCTFVGWCTEANCDGSTIYYENDTFSITEDTVLYGYWDCNPECTAIFTTNNEDGVVKLNDTPVTYGEPTAIPLSCTTEVEAPEGCCFVGFFDLDRCTYIQPCEEPEEMIYKRVYLNATGVGECFTGTNNIVDLSQSDFISEIHTDTPSYDLNTFIRSEVTGEVRQLVGKCADEAYDIPCNSHIMAVFECCSFEEITEDGGHNYTDCGIATNFYEFLEEQTCEGDTYLIVTIDDTECYYINMPCNKENDKYHVTYDMNLPVGLYCGETPIDSNAYIFGQVATVLPNVCEIEHCEFIGWCTEANCDGSTIYYENDEIEMTSDITLYGVWECCGMFISSNRDTLELLHWEEGSEDPTTTIMDGYESGRWISMSEGDSFRAESEDGCCFMGFFDMSEGRYIDSCAGSADYYIYQQLPIEGYGSRSGSDTTTLSDSDFLIAIQNHHQTNEYGTDFILNERTGEIRQIIGVCESQYRYTMSCGAVVKAIFACCTIEETEDTGQPTEDYEIYEDFRDFISQISEVDYCEYGASTEGQIRIGFGEVGNVDLVNYEIVPCPPIP